jgi:uncharacterized protein YuzE
MKITYDHTVDALYITLTDVPVVTTRSINDDFVLDLDEFDQVVGIEVLRVRESGINPLDVLTRYYTADHQPAPPDPAEIERRRAAINAARKRKRERTALKT